MIIGMTSGFRYTSYAMLALMLFAVCRCAIGGQALTKKEVICEHFLGFGAEWDSHAYTVNGVTDEDFRTIARRVEWMRMPVARVMMLTRYCYQGKGQYDFETREMKDLYRHLDVCERIGSTVFLTDWGIERGWLTAHDLQKVTDPKYAEAIATYMDHLIVKKKYTCIKYFILGNEPDFEVGNYNRWKKGYLNLHQELSQRGLLKKVKLVGPDVGGKRGWFEAGVRDLNTIAMAYDFHRYERKATVRAGKFGAYVSSFRNYALKHDPKAADKPLIVGEAGMKDGSRPPATNKYTPKFEYGLFMADYAVQAVNGGAGSVMAWMLDDNSHKGFTWGMWDNKPNGLKLKPWFYPWSLLCRYIPAGSRILRTGLSSADVRVLAAKSDAPGSKHKGWTFCIVNRADATKTIKLQAQGGSRVPMRRYVYSKASRKADRDGFPVPVDSKRYDLDAGTPLECDAESVTILTSME